MRITATVPTFICRAAICRAAICLAAIGLAAICLAACSDAPSQSASEQALMRQDGWRQRQAVLDAEAILEGMQQARLRAEMQARMAR